MPSRMAIVADSGQLASDKMRQVRQGELVKAEAFDVISFDSCGVPFDGWTPTLSGLGGSESQDIIVLESLAKCGLRVLSINRLVSQAIVNGVTYLPMAQLADKIKTKALILQRASALPENIEAERLFVRAHDVYSEWSGYNVHDPLFTDGNLKPTLLCVSEWQRKGYPSHWPSMVVYNSIPDWVYDDGTKGTRNSPSLSFFYASAAIKGLEPTLRFFQDMKTLKAFRGATLDVCCPGYSAPDGIEIDGVRYLGSLTFPKLIAQYQKHRNLLHISTFKECCPLAHIMSEILGQNTFFLATQGEDGTSEVVNSKLVTENQLTFNANLKRLTDDPQLLKPVEPKDFRASTMVKKWLEILK